MPFVLKSLREWRSLLGLSIAPGGHSSQGPSVAAAFSRGECGRFVYNLRWMGLGFRGFTENQSSLLVFLCFLASLAILSLPH